MTREALLARLGYISTIAQDYPVSQIIGSIDSLADDLWGMIDNNEEF